MLFSAGIAALQTWAMAGAGTVGLAGTIAGAAVNGAVNPSSRLFGSAVCHGSMNRRSIALTFDDGPSPGSAALAWFLRDKGVRSTFFVCGTNVERHAGIARDLVNSGHELGNHTYSHRRLCPRVGWKMNLLTSEAIEAEFTRAQRTIAESTGVVPRTMRPPYGLRWRGVDAARRKLDMTTVLWSVIGHDWEWPASRVVEHVVSRATPGGIICLHDGRDTRVNPDISETFKAVREIVSRLTDLGYRFETVSELLIDAR